MNKYMPRIVDEVLKFKLESKGAVWIKGPKWCGKSTTAKQFAKTVIEMQDEENRENNINRARISPALFLEGEPPLLIDEWQTIPFIWNQIRLEVDRRNKFGQFILTGSVVPREDDDTERHSGIGRITELIMRPMSLYESRESSGKISLKKMFDGEKQNPVNCSTTLKEYAFITARGGWPQAINCSERVALQQAIDYYKGLISSEMKYADRVKRSPDRINLLIRSYARNCSTQANIATIKTDMKSNDDSVLDDDTVISYINALKKLYVIEESEAWNPNLRSKTAIRTSNTRYFVDPSIACAALGIGPKGLIEDLNLFGLLFENLCVRDLRIYADLIDGTVKHYRDSSGTEVDAVITTLNGVWGAIEIKLGSKELIDDGANNLLKLASNLDEKMTKPSFLMVLTATDFAYQREDGVWVVPIGCLGP